MRKLATVQVIKELEDIKGKDRIKLASFVSVGFKCIVGSDYNVGDKVVYFEVDSLIPTRDEFEFLRQRCYKAKYDAYHIKCMKMAGVYSEGLAFKCLIAEQEKDGYDLTEAWGIKKYDPEAEEEAKVLTKKITKSHPLIKFLWNFKWFRAICKWQEKRNRPDKLWGYIGKSDQSRYQNLNYLFTDYSDMIVDVTQKMDGQSMTVSCIKGKVTVASRNIVFGKKTSNRYTDIANKCNIVKLAVGYYTATGHDVAIQSENCGVGIQGNKYGLASDKSFVYDIKDLSTGKYLTVHEYKKWCHYFGAETVAYLGEFKIGDGSELRELSNSCVLAENRLPHEGIVCRSTVHMEPLKGMSNYFGFKIISEKFMELYHS